MKLLVGMIERFALAASSFSIKLAVVVKQEGGMKCWNSKFHSAIVVDIGHSQRVKDDQSR